MRLITAIAIALISATGAHAQSKDKAAEVVLNEYTVYRVSPAAPYFTPGSLIMGWSLKGVMRLEMVCRNKIDVEANDQILKAPIQQAGFSGTSGWQFDVGATATTSLNASLKGNFVSSVSMTIDNPVVYEYSAEDLRDIRRQILARPACAAEVRNARYRIREYNGAKAGLFQNQRFVIGDVTYTVNFNKDNPKALDASVQADITKKFQAKFGLSYLNASVSQLKGSRMVIGLYPIWRDLWN